MMPVSPSYVTRTGDDTMTTAIYYHGGCGVCVDAERTVVDALDRTKYAVELVHLGEHPDRVAEAERAGVKTLPALVIGGRPFHINFGADIAAVKP
jgi:glutaredoxin